MIESPLLPECGGYIDGAWLTSGSGGTLDVVNPATGSVLGVIPKMGTAEAMHAVEASGKGLDATASVRQRRDWLTAIRDQLLEHQRELGRIITLEQGKPLAEAQAEVAYAAGFFGFFAEQGAHLEPSELPEPVRGCRWTIHHRPAGVAALITPWNFPLAMLAKKLAPALMAGCTVVAKPAKLTPLTAMAFWHLADQVGVAPGLLNLVVGDHGPIGEVLCTDPAVRILSFTGSTEVGRHLIARTAPHVKRLAMELGGNAPFIVFDDADLASAAGALIANKFRAGGQTCVCTNRVYVDARVADAFTERVADRVSKLRVGDGMDADVDVGPLINRDGFDKVAAHVGDALTKGAERVVGSDPPRPTHDWGAFYPPTVLTGVKPQMLLCRAETFGPVVAISTFTSEAEVLAVANETIYGLAAYVCTRDAARAERVIAGLRFGHIGLNTSTGPTPEAPFGGMKQSGFGREGGVEGLLEFCETQVVASA